MGGKKELKDSEVDEAVDALMSSLGVKDVAESPALSHFDMEDEFSVKKEVRLAPSASADALWGAPKPKQK